MARRSSSQRRYDRYEMLRGRLIDTVRKHITFRSTHAELLADERRLVFDTKEYRSLTIGQRDCIREVQRVWHDRIYELHLEWILGTAEGPIADDWSTGRLSDLSRTPGALFGAHVWKGSDRLYGEWKPLHPAKEAK
jgi:hypothetical protein